MMWARYEVFQISTTVISHLSAINLSLIAFYVVNEKSLNLVSFENYDSQLSNLLIRLQVYYYEKLSHYVKVFMPDVLKIQVIVVTGCKTHILTTSFALTVIPQHQYDSQLLNR